MDEVLENILVNLTSIDLRVSRLVSWSWYHIILRITEHKEGGKLGWGWREGEPKLSRMQCTKERSVCTVTTMDVDTLSIAAGPKYKKVN